MLQLAKFQEHYKTVAEFDESAKVTTDRMLLLSWILLSMDKTAMVDLRQESISNVYPESFSYLKSYGLCLLSDAANFQHHSCISHRMYLGDSTDADST